MSRLVRATSVRCAACFCIRSVCFYAVILMSVFLEPNHKALFTVIMEMSSSVNALLCHVPYIFFLFRSHL